MKISPKKVFLLVFLTLVLIAIFNVPNYIFFNFENRIRHNPDFSRETNTAVINLVNLAINIIYQRVNIEDVDLDAIFTERFQNPSLGGLYCCCGFFRSYDSILMVDRNYMRRAFEHIDMGGFEMLIVPLMTREGWFERFTLFEVIIIQKECGEYLIDFISLDR
jgi:hypothetical protein